MSSSCISFWFLGDGERLFENVGSVEFQQVRTIAAPGVTHVKYRVLG